MKLEALSRIRKPLRILLSVSLVMAGLCLMWACLSIYRAGGDQPFSRESVASAFRPISLPVYLCLGLTVLSFLAELLPCPAEKQIPARQLHMALARMQERVALDLCSSDLRCQIQNLRSTRKMYTIIGNVVMVIGSIIFLTYGLNGKNFHSTQINDSMIRAMNWLLPCTAVPFLLYVFIEKKNRVSMETELELLKSAPKESRVAAPKHRSHRREKFLLRTGLLVLGLVILVYGYFAGGTADVLTKAVNICTECVGLG